MYALEHLEGVLGRRSLVAPPEKSVLASVDMRMEVFGSLVHHALKKVCVFEHHVCINGGGRICLYFHLVDFIHIICL